MELVINLFLIGGGLFALVAVAFDWDFFMNDGKAEFFVSKFGRNRARLFYGALGLAILTAGVLLLTGVLENSS